MVVKVDIFPSDTVPVRDLTYVVMGAKYQDQWVFVRHRERSTWEMPAGHIEPGESPDDAAHRELKEETGALDCSLKHLLDYAVTVNDKREFGRLYFALINELGPIPAFEIEERIFARKLPFPRTYPEVQGKLFNRVKDFGFQ